MKAEWKNEISLGFFPPEFIPFASRHQLQSEGCQLTVRPSLGVRSGQRIIWATRGAPAHSHHHLPLCLCPAATAVQCTEHCVPAPIPLAERLIPVSRHTSQESGKGLFGQPYSGNSLDFAPHLLPVLGLCPTATPALQCKVDTDQRPGGQSQ